MTLDNRKSSNKDKRYSIDDYDLKLEKSLYSALLMFYHRRSKRVEEPCVAAIYNYCLGLILTIRETFASVSGTNITIEPGSSEIAKANFGRYAEDANYWKHIRDECIEVSKSKYREVCHLDFPIYTENTERLDYPNVFREGIEMLAIIAASTSSHDKYKLFSKFYSYGEIP